MQGIQKLIITGMVNHLMQENIGMKEGKQGQHCKPIWPFLCKVLGRFSQLSQEFVHLDKFIQRVTYYFSSIPIPS